MQTATQLKPPPIPTHSTLAKTRPPAIAAPTLNGNESPALDTQPEENGRINHSFGAISVFPPDPSIQPKRQTTVGHRLSAFTLPIQRKVNPLPKLPASWTVHPPIQAKLTVGPVNDQYEQEADRVADQVMRMSEPRVQAKCACGGEAGADGECAACKAKRVEVQRRVQLKSQDEEEVVQAKSNDTATDATPDLESRLNSNRGSGQSLPEETRSSMESAFGADFGGVRVHTGNEAVQMNRELSAQAFTHGSDIYFNAGKYEPGSAEGKGLLAHELTHVVQQGKAMSAKGDHGSVSMRMPIDSDADTLLASSVPAPRLQKNPKKVPEYKQHPCDDKEPTNAKIFSFIRAHAADAAKIGTEVGVPADWILAVSAEETEYGRSGIVTRTNNFFGLHVSNANDTKRFKNQTGAEKTRGTPPVFVAVFSVGSGFLDSGMAFASIEKANISGGKEFHKFAVAIHEHGYGVNSSSYVADLESVHELIAARVDCTPSK